MKQYKTTLPKFGSVMDSIKKNPSLQATGAAARTSGALTAGGISAIVAAGLPNVAYSLLGPGIHGLGASVNPCLALTGYMIATPILAFGLPAAIAGITSVSKNKAMNTEGVKKKLGGENSPLYEKTKKNAAAAATIGMVASASLTIGALATGASPLIVGGAAVLGLGPRRTYRQLKNGIVPKVKEALKHRRQSKAPTLKM